MSQTSSKEIEKRYFERFRKAYQSLPDGDVIHREKPDVLINGSRKVGIEITKLYIKDGSLLESEQVQKSVREHVIKIAQQIYMSEGRKPIGITFKFNEEQTIQNKQNLIDKVVRLARNIEMFESGEISRTLFKDIPELSDVWLWEVMNSDEKWKVMRTGTSPDISVEWFDERVRKKEEAAKNYAKCHAYWLLVVVDWFDTAQDQEIRVEGLEEIKSRIFEKIIVYRTAYEHIVEINNTNNFNKINEIRFYQP